MNSINIYASNRRLTPRHKKVSTHAGITLFIRTQLVKNCDCETAMGRHNNTQPGECFLNSVDEISFEH